MNSATSYSFGSRVRSFLYVILHVLVLEICLVDHHLVYHHLVVAAGCLTEVGLLSILSAAALRHLAPLLRNGTSEVLISLCFLILITVGSWLRIIVTITLPGLSILYVILAPISMSSTARYSLRLKFANLLNLILHIDY